MPKFRLYIKDMAAQEIEAASWVIEDDEALVIFYDDDAIHPNKRQRSKHIVYAVKLSDFQAVELL